MDIIKMARELGKEIQNTTEYLNLMSAKQKNDNDSELTEIIGQFNLVKLEIEHMSVDNNEDNQKKINVKNEELRELYKKIMKNENMIIFNEASKKVNDMMNKVNTILTAAINGEDPMTCSTKIQITCNGDCGECSGCK